MDEEGGVGGATLALILFVLPMAAILANRCMGGGQIIAGRSSPADMRGPAFDTTQSQWYPAADLLLKMLCPKPEHLCEKHPMEAAIRQLRGCQHTRCKRDSTVACSSKGPHIVFSIVYDIRHT